MGTTPRNFTIQTWDNVAFFNASTDQLIASSMNTKTGTLDNTLDLLYPTGSQGNVYVAPAWTANKRAMIDFVFATVDLALMGAQMGTDVTTGAASVRKEDKVEITSDTATTTETPTGTVGAEIQYAYILDSNGYETTVLTQAATATATEFSFTGTTLTFNTGDYPDGTTVKVYYNYTTGVGSQTIIQSATGAPSTVKFNGWAWVKDICDGSLYYANIIADLCQIDGNWNWELAADSEGATQPMKLEFIKPCNSTEFYRIIIIDPV